MGQLRYTEDSTRAFAGLIADLSNKTIVSKSAEDIIPFGYGVEQGTADEQVLKYVGGTLKGIATHIHNEAKTYEANDTVNVMTKGKVWVRLVSGVTPAIDGLVYCNSTTGDFQAIVTGAVLVPNAVFRSANVDSSSHFEAVDNDGAVALVEINLPS
jgi:hypothetical protein